MPEGMEPIQAIEAALIRVAQRQQLAKAFQGVASGLLLGSGGVVLLECLHKLAPIPPLSRATEVITVICFCLVGGTLKGLKRPDLGQVARWVDEKLDLQERLTAAWELRSTGVTGEWQSLVTRDAATHAASLNANTLVPYHSPRGLRWIGVCAALWVVLAFVDPIRSAAFRGKEQDKKVIAETGKKLLEITRQQVEQRHPALESSQKAVNEALEFGQQLSEAKLSRGEAITDLASLAQKLEQEAKQLADRPGVRSLELASRASTPTAGKGANDLQQRMQAMKDALGAAEGKDKLLSELKEKLEAARKASEQLPAAGTPEAAAARENLARALENAAREATEAGIPLEGLDEAVAALKNAQTDFFLRDIQGALSSIDKLQQLAQSLQQLKEEQAKEARTLPEQLQKGQAQAAKQRLEEMIKKLKAGPLSKADRELLVDELEKALSPAEQYEKLPEPLKKALQKARTGRPGDQEGAAENLAEAAKELDRLQQELADADQLAGVADLLREAQDAIGQGRGFQQGKAAARRPRAGHAGKPGRGVGTWGQDSNLEQPESAEGWDNSGLTQPTLDSRSVVSEDAPDKNPNLAPARVKGQMSPGGSMPSITLKGVHIKGQSNAKFTETAATAQADAQKALNQDKVPRAYQDSVKTYFDDFK